MLHEFLSSHQAEVLALTEQKTLKMAGKFPTSDELRRGLPIFFQQLMGVLRLSHACTQETDGAPLAKAVGTQASDQAALAIGIARPDEVELARSAGGHGAELLRLGYTLSHVVHAYGAMCQAIAELASAKRAHVTPMEFHDLNRCLDIAIAGAVTEYQTQWSARVRGQEIEHLGFLAHELRNALSSVTLSLHLIKKGTVGLAGNTGRLMENGIQRMASLIDRSLTEVRLRVDQEIDPQPGILAQLVDQIAVTARSEAQSRHQVLDIRIDPTLTFEADHQLLHSALANIIQNAMKFTREGGSIQVRGTRVDGQIEIEVEDECGGLSPEAMAAMFKPFERLNENRKGLGLGLTISQRAMALNHGAIDVKSLPGKGCIFTVKLPIHSVAREREPEAATSRGQP